MTRAIHFVFEINNHPYDIIMYDIYNMHEFNEEMV
jgi:hypothetical protein